MNGIDGTRGRGTAARRWLRTGGLAATGTVLVGGAMLGVASQPAYATPVTCGGLTEAAAKAAGYTTYNNAFSTVKRSDNLRGFVVLPRRWVVERTFGWLSRHRRLVRDSSGCPSITRPWCSGPPP